MPPPVLALVALLAFIVILSIVNRLRSAFSARAEPGEIANLLYRQPERFFIIVPWLLARLLEEESDPELFMRQTGDRLQVLGNFDIHAKCLICCVRLESEPTWERLRELLVLLFEPKPAPLIEFVDLDAQCAVPVRCLEMLYEVGRGLKDRSALKKAKALKLNQKAVKSRITLAKAKIKQGTRDAWIYGEYGDSNVLRDWEALTKLVNSFVDHFGEKDFDEKKFTATQKKGSSRLWFFRNAFADLCANYGSEKSQGS